jgi:hypothetical protein
MAYLVHNIKSFAVEDYPFYFCDANVWIAALKYYGICGGTVDYEKPYQDFISALVNLNELSDPEAIKRRKNNPKIILTCLVLSEVINSYMRKVAMKAYFGNDVEYKNHDFKRDYRDNPVSDYKEQLKNLSTDIIAFSDYTILFNDDFSIIEPFRIITSLPTIDADFNDLYYYNYFKDKNIPVVTHDKDFKFEDIDIITSNRGLLRLSSI